MIDLHNYKGKVLKIIDGDTIDIMVDLGFEVHRKIRCRLLFVDTPERGHEDFYAAKKALEDLIQESQDKEGNIIFSSRKEGKRGSFRRWLIWIPEVSEHMVKLWPAGR